jgi:hypothetical protein
VVLLPGKAGAPTIFVATAYAHGLTSTPISTVKTYDAANAIATVLRIVDTVRFS